MMKKLIFWIFLTIINYWGGAQSTTILRFTAEDLNHRYVQLDSVYIVNLTRGWQEVIYYPDTVLILGTTGIESQEENVSFKIEQNVPNPFEGTTDFVLQMKEQEQITIEVLDLNGKKIVFFREQLQSGIHHFRIKLQVPQIYLLHVASERHRAILKTVNVGSNAKNGIEYIGQGQQTIQGSPHYQSAKGLSEQPFIWGDLMEYVGYITKDSVAYESERIRQQQGTSQTFVLKFDIENIIPTDGQPCLGTPSLVDADGNVYHTVKIGNQCWMKENLRTTKYANGTLIPLGTSSSTTVAYRYYPENLLYNVPSYGLLYNWVAVMNNSAGSDDNPSGVQGVCPTGWHVPSLNELEELKSYLYSHTEFQCDSITENIGKALASNFGWTIYEGRVCAVGNIPSTNNISGFSALAAGAFSGAYYAFSLGAYMWTATNKNETSAYGSWIHSAYAGFYLSDYSIYYAHSVRCISDSEDSSSIGRY